MNRHSMIISSLSFIQGSVSSAANGLLQNPIMLYLNNPLFSFQVYFLFQNLTFWLPPGLTTVLSFSLKQC